MKVAKIPINTHSRHWRSLLLIFPVLILFFGGFAYSQSNPAWDAILADDFEKAERIISNQFEAKEFDEESLLAGLFLAEIKEDERQVKELVDQLIALNPDPVYLSIFEKNLYDKAAKLSKLQGYDQSVLLPFYIQQTENLIQQKEFDKAQNRQIASFNNLQWSVIGPFINKNGYGHERAFGPESDTSRYPKEFPSGYNFIHLKWIDREELNEYDIVDFGDNLPVNYNGATYYARSYWELDQPTDCQLRIGRNCPIKIWINDSLIFESNENRHFNPDNDIVKIHLDAGTHQVLVKCSSLPKDFSPFLQYSQEMVTGEKTADLQVESSRDDFVSILLQLGKKFSLRVTDENGKKIDIKSYVTDLPSYATFSLKEVTNDRMLASLPFKNNDLHQACYDYLRSKAYQKTGAYRDGEDFFYQRLSANSNSVFYRYLLATFYARNFKAQRAYDMLDSINFSSTPILDVKAQQLQYFTKEKYPDQYHNVMLELLKMSPYSKRVIKNELEFLEQYGSMDDAENFSIRWQARHPETTPIFEAIKEDENRETLSINELQQLTDQRFLTEDYVRLIRLLEEDRYGEVYLLYDELIDKIPYATNFRLEKVRTLIEQERWQEANDALVSLVLLAPYELEAYELLGDVSLAQKNKGKAEKSLSYAFEWANAFGYVEDIDRIQEKLNDISKPSTFEQFVDPIAVDDILSDSSWYEYRFLSNAVVLFYTKDILVHNPEWAEVKEDIAIEVRTAEGAKLWQKGDFSFFRGLENVLVRRIDGHTDTFKVIEGKAPMAKLDFGDVIIARTTYDFYPKYDLEGHWFIKNFMAFNDPIINGRVSMIVDPYYKIKSHHIGLPDDRSLHSRFGKRHYTWTFEKVDGLALEDAVLDITQVYPALQLSSLSDWKPIQYWFLDKFYQTDRLSGHITEVAAKISTKAPTSNQYVIACYDFVQQFIQINYKADYDIDFQPKPADATLEDGKGNILDAATLFKSLLNAGGVEAEYVLVKSKSYGIPEFLPAIDFSHVMLRYRIDSIWQYIDVSNYLFPYYTINEIDAGSWALNLTEEETGLIRLPNDYLNPKKNYLRINTTAKFTKDNRVEAEVEAKAEGISAGFLRSLKKVYKQEDYEKILHNYFGYGSLDEYSLDAYSLENEKGIHEPLIMKLEISDKDHFAEEGKLKLVKVPFMKNVVWSPFIHPDKRDLPFNLADIVDLDPVEETVTITLDRGLEWVEIPDNTSLDNAFFSYEIHYAASGRKLTVEKKQQFKQITVDPKDYKEFKVAYEALAGIDGRKLFIRRK